MQTDEHTSETAWTWTINELCRKVETTPVLTYESFLSRQTDPFHETRTARCVLSSLAESVRAKIK